MQPIKPKGSFCKGLFCKKDQRKSVCANCHKYVCGICSVNDVDGKTRCITDYLKYTPEWDRLNEEFDEMIKSLKISRSNEVKKDVKKDIVRKSYA